MAERTDAPARSGAEVLQDGLQQRGAGMRMCDEPTDCLYQSGVGEWLEKARFVKELALPFSQVAGPHSFATTADHAQAALAQFADFVHHVRLDGRRELIGNVGDGGQEGTSSDAHSIPATVKISPITNWYAMSTKKALNK